MNVTTWKKEYPSELLPAIAGPADRQGPAAVKSRKAKSFLPGLALSAFLHAGVLAFVLYAVSSPILMFPADGDEGIVRVSLVTVMPGPDNGNGAAPAEEAKKKPVQAVKAATPAIQKALEKTVIAEAADHRPAERQAAETSIAVEPARAQVAAAAPGRGSQAAESARGQRPAGASSQEGYSEAMPRYRDNRPPVYPSAARQRGYEGNVLLAAEVRSDGHIGNVRVKRSSGYASLDNSAVEAVKAWRFEPAKRMGSPVDAWVEIPIRFKLSPHDSFM